jgi:hypothetical protein
MTAEGVRSKASRSLIGGGMRGVGAVMGAGGRQFKPVKYIDHVCTHLCKIRVVHEGDT